MTDLSNRVPPAPQPNTGGSHDTATGRGPQRPDNEPQVAPAAAPQSDGGDTAADAGDVRE